jgi:hypothetical protein
MSDTLITQEPKKRGSNLKGRPKGVRNKVTKEVRAVAADYGPEAVRRLAVLGGLIPTNKLRKGERPSISEATQVVACLHILNRAYGFPSQPLSHSANESFETLLDRLERRRLGQPEPVVLEVQTDGSFEAIERSIPISQHQRPRRPVEPPDSHHKPHTPAATKPHTRTNGQLTRGWGCLRTGFERPRRE